MSTQYQNVISRVRDSGAYQYVAPRIQNSALFNGFKEVAGLVTGRAKNTAAYVRAHPEIAVIFGAAIVAEHYLHIPRASQTLSMAGCCFAAVVKDVAQDPSSILDGDKMGKSVMNGGTNWLMGAAVFGVVALTLTAGCTDPSSSPSAATPDNPAMCAIQGPNHTVVLSFGPDCRTNDDGSINCTLVVPDGYSAPHLDESFVGSIKCTKESAPGYAIQGTVVCPIVHEGNTSYVLAEGHPWGKNEADYFSHLKADPAAAQAIPAANTDDSRAIADVVDKVNAVAGYAANGEGAASSSGYDRASRASLAGYNNYIGRYLYPPA